MSKSCPQFSSVHLNQYFLFDARLIFLGFTLPFMVGCQQSTFNKPFGVLPSKLAKDFLKQGIQSLSAHNAWPAQNRHQHGLLLVM